MRATAPGLTRRELTIIDLMSGGDTAPEIARKLALCPRTVENHCRHIYSKLRVRSRGHAISRALSLGLLDPKPTAPKPTAPKPRREDPLLVAVHGPAGQARDDVVAAVLATGAALVQLLRHERRESKDHWARWHRGPLIAVLVDPTHDDWSIPRALGAALIAVHSKEGDLRTALDHDAAGLVSHADVATDLDLVLGVVARGHFAMSGAYTRQLHKTLPTDRPTLTAREHDILAGIGRGDTVRQTARSLGIAAKTVENTQARLFRKLGARNRMDCLAIADRWSLLPR